MESIDALSQRALTDTIFIYSYNSVTNTVKERIEFANSYDFDKLKKLYFHYVFQAYNNAKKIVRLFCPKKKSPSLLNYYCQE